MGLAGLMLGMLVSEPTMEQVGAVMILLGLVLTIVWLFYLVNSKVIHKTPMKKVVKNIGLSALPILLLGGIISAPYAESNRQAREEAAKVEKAKQREIDRKAEEKAKKESERKAKDESKAKAKSESEAKAKAESESKENKKLEEKKKKESEAKAKSESEAKQRAEEESRVKAQAKQESEQQAKAESALKAQTKVEQEQQEKAQEQQAATAPVAEAPAGTTEGVTGVIIGNSKSGIYHVPGQRHYNSMSNKNKVYFNSEAEARAAGFRRSMR